jgi:hypothetical protein
VRIIALPNQALCADFVSKSANYPDQSNQYALYSMQSASHIGDEEVGYIHTSSTHPQDSPASPWPTLCSVEFPDAGAGGENVLGRETKEERGGGLRGRKRGCRCWRKRRAGSIGGVCLEMTSRLVSRSLSRLHFSLTTVPLGFNRLCSSSISATTVPSPPPPSASASTPPPLHCRKLTPTLRIHPFLREPLLHVLIYPYGTYRRKR